MISLNANAVGRAGTMGLPGLLLGLCGLMAPLISAAENATEENTVQPPQIEVRSAEVFNMVRQGRALAAEGYFAESLEVLRRAQSWQPDNIAVAHELQRVEALAGEAAADGEERSDNNTVNEQLITELLQAEMRVRLRRAELQLAEDDYQAAEETLQAARSHLQNYPWTQAQELTDRLQTLLEEARDGRDAVARRQARALRQQSQVDALLRSEQEQALRRSALVNKLERVIATQQRGHLELALAQARGLMRDYPEQPQVARLFDRLLEQVHEKRELSTEQARQERQKEVFRRVHDALIPDGFNGQPQFPHDWQERANRQASGLDALVEIPPWQANLMERLQMRLSVDFVNIDPSEALDFLANRSGINLVLASEVRMAANAPVTLQASNMRVESILNWLTRQLGVTWKFHNQAVYVGGEQFAEPILRVYDLGEALFTPPELAGPSVEQFSLGEGGGGGGGGGAGFDLFGNDGGIDAQGVVAADILDLIREAIDPEAWNNPDYTMEVRSETYLVVNAPPRLHNLIREFLRAQMGANRVLVHSTMRWLEITDTHLEEIGVDWQQMSSDLLGNPRLGARGARRESSVASAAAGLVNRLPETAMDVGPALATSGLNLQFMRLGATQLSAMLTAVERTGRSRVVSAMDLTSIHGQRAHAQFLRQVAYISDYDVEAGGGEGTLSPVISVLNVGDIIDLQPFVSADRKYVSMDVRPVTSTVEFFVEQLSVITTVGDFGVVLSFPLELPNLRINTAGTRVMIPDGGSIMVGGFTEALNQNSQANIPFVGHIPFLGRLFGRRGRYEQNTQLYLTLTVDIILYDEEEAFL